MKKLLNTLGLGGGRYDIQLISGVIYNGEIEAVKDTLHLKIDHTDRIVYINFDHIMSVRKS